MQTEINETMHLIHMDAHFLALDPKKVAVIKAESLGYKNFPGLWSMPSEFHMEAFLVEAWGRGLKAAIEECQLTVHRENTGLGPIVSDDEELALISARVAGFNSSMFSTVPAKFMERPSLAKAWREGFEAFVVESQIIVSFENRKAHSVH